MAKFRGSSQIPSSGRIEPTIPISADLTEAYQKVDEFIGKVGKKQLIKVDADVSAARGRLQRLLDVKGNNIQLDIGINQKLLKNSLADAKKLIRGAASALSVGDNSQYGQMRDTLASFIHGFENLSVVSGGKVVSGITDILKNVRNFDSITNMSFDVSSLQQAAKVTEDIAEAEVKITKERQKRSKADNLVQETEVLKTTLDRISKIRNAVNRMSRELGKMDDNLGSSEQLDARLKRFDKYSGKLGEFKEELNGLGGDATDTNVSDGINKILTVIDNTLSSIGMRAENAQLKLKTLVSEAFGKLQKLSNDPLSMDNEEKINGIYQERLDIINQIGEKILKNRDPEKYEEVEKVNDSYKKRLDVLREQKQSQEENKSATVKIEEAMDALGKQSKAFKSTTSSLDELKEKYFSIIKTVETYLELMLKFNKIEGNTWPKLRKNMINFIKDMPQDVIEMLTMDYGDKFTEGLRNSFKGMSSKDLFNMIKSPSWANTMGALELKLNLAKNVDFDNIKYTDDGSIKLLDSDNPFEHLHPQHGIRLIEELYKTLDAIAKITSNHQEQLTTVVEKTADKSEIVAQNAEQLRDAYDKADEKVHSLRDSLAQATDEQERLEQHAKVYGYTLDMSAQKAGRIQSVLSKTGTQFTIARAQAIPNLLKDGYEVDKYSDEYGISVPVSTSYTPITKTEYEYAQYLSSKIAELNVGWEEGLKILASQNGQLDAARQKVAQLEDELSIAEKQAEIAYERMAYASHGVFGNDNIEADKKRLAQSNAQTEANKKLTSSYEGLVEAVEKFHTVNQKAWSAYKNNSPDYQQLAQTKDNAIAGIQNLFPTGSVRDDIPAMLNSSGLKDANIEDILGFIESKLKYAVSEARTIANGEFVKQNVELTGQFANTDNFKDFEAKFTALSADILEGKLGLEGANKQLQEFADSLLNSTKAQVKAEQELSKMILGSSGETLAGTKPISFKYAVMSVEDLVMSHNAYGAVNKNYPSELQPRDRNRMASKTQILSMVKNLLPELLVASPTAQNGSPIVSNDGIVVGGNARSAALAEAYATGHADGYKAYITEHAAEFGLSPNNMPKNPVLVRVVDIDGGLDTLAKQLNESTTAGYSTTEQALINEELVMKVISKLNIDESANLNSEANRDFIKAFMGLLPDNQRNEMMTKDGSLSAIGLTKTTQALAGAAYGSRDMLENLEQIDPDLKNISNAFISSAAKAADIRHSIESGMLNDLGVISTLLNGVDLLKTSRSKNQNIEEYLNQLSLFGSDYAAEDVAIGKFFEANVRNATQLKHMIDTILDFARNAGDPNQLSFGDFENVTLSEVVRGAFAKYAEQYKKKIDYDKLMGEHLPAEVGSRSDKRVDRTDAFEAESKMTPAIEANTRAKQEQANAVSEATKQIEAQVGAEKKLGETVEKTDTTSQISNIDKATKAIENEGKAANAAAKQKKEFTDANKKLAKSGEDTAKSIDKASEAIKKEGNIAEMSDDSLTGGLESEALQKLREASLNETLFVNLKTVLSKDDLETQIRGMVQDIGEWGDLSLGKISVSSKSDDIVKIDLYNDKMKTSIQQTWQLVGATEEMDAHLKLVGEKYNYNTKALEQQNQKISDFVKNVNTQINAWTKEGYLGKDNLFEKTDEVFDASGKKISDLGQEVKQFQSLVNNTDISGDFKQLEQEFDNISDKAREKIKSYQTYVNTANKNYFQNAYKYDNNGKTYQDQREQDSMRDYYKQQESEAQQFNNNIKGIYDQLVSTLKQIGTVDAKMSQVFMQDKGSGVYSEVLSGLQTEHSSLVANMRSLSSELQSVLNLPQGVSGLDAIFTDTRIQTALTKDEIQKLDDALKNLENIQFNFAAKLTQQIQPVVDKVQSLKQMIADGFISQDSDIAKNVLNIESAIANKRKNYTETGSVAAAQDLIQYTNSVNEYVSALEKAAQAEQKYFTGKNKYTPGDKAGSYDEYIENQIKTADEAQKKLENAAREFVKDSGYGDAMITKFSKTADGISKIDFSVFDSGANILRNFRMEMGTVTDGIYEYETTINKSVANMKAAEKQLEKIGSLLVQLDASGVNVSEKGAPPSVANLLKARNDLAKALQEGDQNILTKSLGDARFNTAEVEKLYKQMMNMQQAISSGNVFDLGQISANGNIYNQMIGQIKDFAATQPEATLALGKFDERTKTLGFTLTDTKGSVTEFKASMDSLTGTIAAQQTGVGQIGSVWNRLGTELRGVGKLLKYAVVGYSASFQAINFVKKGIQDVRDIDLALTELKKVTNETESAYDNFLQTSSKTASTIGTTVSDFTNASADFARLGYTMEESADMAKTAIVYKNVADGLDTVEESTESIISTMKAFGIESDNTMMIVDKFNEVGKYIAQIA